MAEARDGRAYIGSFTSAGGHGITVAAVDPETGGLTRLGEVGDVADPSFLELAPDAGVLYCVSETEQGGAAAFSLADPDHPRLLGTRAVRGAGPTHLSLAPGGGALLTANYVSGSVSVLPVREDGSLGEASHVAQHLGSGPNQERQEGPHAHQVLPDPSGRWLLAVDLGADFIRVYALEHDPEHARAALRTHGEECRLRGGTGPRHLVFHPGGELVYVMNELESVVTVFRWDAEAGQLHELAETVALPEDARGPNYPSNAVVSPDGRFLYAAHRGHNSIAVLAVGGAGEHLRLVTTVPCGGDWPRHLTAGPSGRRLYVANERSGAVAWFDLDPQSGVPRQTGAMPVAAASCVVFR